MLDTTLWQIISPFHIWPCCVGHEFFHGRIQRRSLYIGKWPFFYTMFLQNIVEYSKLYTFSVKNPYLSNIWMNFHVVEKGLLSSQGSQQFKPLHQPGKYLIGGWQLFILSKSKSNAPKAATKEEPDRKILLWEVKSFDADSKALLVLILWDLVVNHPQVVVGHITRLYNLPWDVLLI